MVAAFTISGATLTGLAPWLPQALKDLNTGVIALVANLLVLGLVTMITRRHRAVRGAPSESVTA